MAIARNPDVRSAQRALEAAEAARRAAVGKLFPQLQALSWYELFPTQPALLLPRYMAVPSLSQIGAPNSLLLTSGVYERAYLSQFARRQRAARQHPEELSLARLPGGQPGRRLGDPFPDAARVAALGAIDRR